MNTGMLIEMAADGLGERIALGSRKDGLTYAGLLDQARRVATVVAESGAERLVFVARNSARLPALLFGSGLAGVPFVPVNYRLADEQLCALLARTAPAVAVVDDDAVGRISGVDGLTVLDAGRARRRGWRRPNRRRPASSTPTRSRCCSTPAAPPGEPKAAVLRHKHLASYVISTVEFMGAGDDHAALVSVPPYHVAGMATILTSVYGGRRLVYLPQFDPQAVGRRRPRRGHHPRHGRPDDARPDPRRGRGPGRDAPEPAPPGLRRRPDADPDTGTGAGAAAGGRLRQRLRPHRDRSTVAMLGPEDHRVAFGSDDPAIRARLGSVGRPLPTLEVEIRDPDGTALPAGERGEIYVRGEQVAGEYLGRSALTADGWFPTNDGGWLDDDGFLFVEGRLDDVIVRGAENLSPGEIEDALLTHPGVAEAGVVGIPDDEWGETVAAASRLWKPTPP